MKNIARALGDDVSEEKPILDSRLPDGSRVAAVFPPCSVGGTTLTIRKFQTRFFTAEELVRIGTMTPEVLAHVRAAIEKNENILISGGTSTGKTTLLNALAAFLPANDRVVLIEDTAELQIDRPNLVRFEARREQAGLPAVDDSRPAAGDAPPSSGSHHRRRGARRGSVRLAAGAQYRPLRHALDHSRELGGPGARAVLVLRGAERRRAAVSGRPVSDRRRDRSRAPSGTSSAASGVVSELLRIGRYEATRRSLRV